MRKNLITGAAILALLMNAPQVSADDDVVIFGGEFEDEAAPSAPTKKPKPVEKPAPPKPKVDKPKEEPAPTKPPVEEKPLAEQPKEEPAPINPPVEEKPLTEQPKEEPAPVNPQPPLEVLPQVEQPFNPPTNISGERFDEPTVIVPPTPEQRPAVEERRILPPSSTPKNPAPQQELKTLKPRFIKLAVDDTYTYYLDKTSVQWKKMPYMASEYMADVWIRMIEHSPAPLDNDMENYGADNFRAEVALAREKGYQYSPEDLKVLRSQAYVLEHYYLRPKTKQIQFLCELEVFGRPQNAINERAYDYRNWENLVPGSVESAIYDATIKIIGKSKASERGHMTFIDMLDEYARIALN